MDSNIKDTPNKQIASSGPSQSTGGGDQTTESEPSLSLPKIASSKGGGALRGIDEKFSTNAFNGTASLVVPVNISPSRSGFQPTVSLTYGSGDGNGPFGLGWSLTTPSVTRKTDKGLPKYMDFSDSDCFILSGSEDLVPRFKTDRNGNVLVNASGQATIDEASRNGFIIRRYVPRVESAFARVERWTRYSDGDVHWRTITGANVTTVFGIDASSRVADIETGNIFSWLCSYSYDDKGNAMVYSYKSESSENLDVNAANELNRVPEGRSVNRYVKSIKYGNLKPNRDVYWNAFDPHSLDPARDWMFEVIFDYGEHDSYNPTVEEEQPWPARMDPFSSYRSAFEVRTYRLCRRILMFHHFPDELGVQDYLVRSLDISYRESPIASYATSFMSSGYRLSTPDLSGKRTYSKSSVPPLDLEYSLVPEIAQLAAAKLQDLDKNSLVNVPAGVDGSSSQWIDLDGEGLPGVLTLDSGSWYYKRNTSANNIPDSTHPQDVIARLSAHEEVRQIPDVTSISSSIQLLELASDGQLDAVLMSGGISGFWERDTEGTWDTFRDFRSFPNIPSNDPNWKFVDVTGDGLADILITEQDAFTWYPSKAHTGFGNPERVSQALDEEKGPRLVFSEAIQSIFLADMTGDGLVDLVRIRNSDICYWPNLGYGRFGARVMMDHAPCFENFDGYNPKKVHLADVDGSGTSDLIYFGTSGVDIYLNQAGNGFSEAIRLASLDPMSMDYNAIAVIDLLGAGTSCVVISSKLPGDGGHSIRYLDLMGGQKPHLLTKIVNNMGAETQIQYSPSTRFYLDDKDAGHPWVSRLHFPVHCVQRVDTLDMISQCRFSTRYAYHHGYYDGVEREFRGFAMVETWDSEVIDQLVDEQAAPVNMDKSSSIPPVRTKTWFHTGVYKDASAISTHLRAEYFQSDEIVLLPDSILKNFDQLSGEEAREALRALKGSTLRSETYSEDGTDLASIPYIVKEQNYTVSTLQPRQSNTFAAFHSQSFEDLTYHLERQPDDGRMQHTIVLEADQFGNILKSIQIAYGRRTGKSALQQAGDIQKQEQTYITYAESDVTNMIITDEEYRLPATCETRSWEITGLVPTSPMQLWPPSFFIDGDFSVLNGLTEIQFEELSDPNKLQKRMLKCQRILYRKNDLSGDLPLGQQETLGLMAAIYVLAFTPGLLASVYQKTDSTGLSRPLLENVTDTLGSTSKGAYVNLDKDGRWWVPSGRAYFHIDGMATAAQEIAEARNNFFLLRRRVDQFGNQNVVTYDPSRLLGQSSEDALGNTLTAVNDYRVLQPTMVTDANGNRVQNAFDTLGIVCASALRGKTTQNLGDNVDGIDTEVTQADIETFFQDPKGPLTRKLLGNASTRQIYDTNRYWRTKSTAAPEPAFSATISRETHSNDLGGDTTKIQLFFSYFDGFGRDIQRKMEAEAGPIDDSTTIISPTRWSTRGWTIFDNKSNPVKKFEPYFTPDHHFSPGRQIGVASTIFYDPLSRPVATLHPNHTWEKTVRGVWDEVTWDMNDTCNIPDPRMDPDVGNFFARLPDSGAFLPSWVDARRSGTLGNDEKTAALQALDHANTPAISHLDSLGRVMLTIADNGSRGKYENRIVVDVEGKPLARIDAKGRTYTQSRYNVLGAAIYETGMESGEGWTLHDCAGRNMLSWNGRNFSFRYEFDVLGRPSRSFVTDGNGLETLFNQKIYGESVREPEKQNLRARIYQSLDQAGIVTTLAYDFKGNTLESQRQLWQEYKNTVDLASPPALEETLYKSSTQFDALNRAFQVVTPEQSTVVHTYNEASLLETVTAKLHPRNGQANGLWETFVSNIDYNAKGQRVSLTHGNGTVSTFTYDPITYRLIRMRLTKGTTVLQDLNYTSDPVGNVIAVRDKAQQTVYFRNTVVDASTTYIYDPLYRLVSANGREHLGQSSGAPGSPTPPDASDSFQTRTVGPGDGNAMVLYTETYNYDEVGNILSLRHDAGSAGSWTRTYGYNEPSALEPSKKSNRLSTTTIGKARETYAYDEHGNMTKMPHLSLMKWNFQDRLQATSKQNFNDGTPEITYYIYDNSGQRVRKVTERSAAAGQEAKHLNERIYIGSFFEVYHEFPGSGPDAPSLERETLHIFDDKDRVCTIETRTIGVDKAPEIQRRYSHGNHIGSVALELSDKAEVISYEEYFPYGGTSYQAMASQTDLPKRYRYTGKERDEENGFYYHGARYYASWLGRWTACDPGGYGDGPNLYQYVRSNPISMADPNGADAMLPPFMQEYGKHIIDTVHNKVNDYLGHVQTDSKVGQTLLGVAQAGVDLASGVAVMEVAPAIAGQEMAQNMAKTFHEYDGGFKGAFMAANQLNPAYHMIENGAGAIDAYKAGNFREMGRKGAHATVDAVATIALVDGGAGLIEGMAEGVGAGVTEAGIEGSVEAGTEGVVESTPTPEPPSTPAAEPAPVEAPPPPPAEPVPAAAPPPPPAPPVAPATCPQCGKLKSDYGPGPVTRANGTQTLPAGTHDVNQGFNQWHPSDLDSFKPPISLKQIRKGDVAPELGKGRRGVGKGDYRERDAMLDKIEKEGGWGYKKGERPKVDIGHEDGPLWSKKSGDPVRKGLSPRELNNAKSSWEKIQRGKAQKAGKFVR